MIGKSDELYELKIEGKFRIYLGKNLYAKGKNKWTRYFVSTIVQQVANTSRSTGSGASRPETIVMLPAHSYTSRAGSDTSTPTDPSMSDLVNKINVAPDTQTRVLFKETDRTKYWCRYKFLWDPGTISPCTIGELGVYLYLSDDSWSSPVENPNLWYEKIEYPAGRTKATWVPYINPAVRLGARVSSADGDFDPIDYTSEEALIFEWYVVIKF